MQRNILIFISYNRIYKYTRNSSKQLSNFITYKASAGSGKTYTLALEYIKQLLLSDNPNAHRHILAVTFTKDATGEMKDRILAELYSLAADIQEQNGFLDSLMNSFKESKISISKEDIQKKAKHCLTEILHDYSRFYVGTIDSFFQRVLRNLARELGKGSRFNIELNTTKVIDEAVQNMIERSHEDKNLLEWITRYVSTKIEHGQSWRIDYELKSFGQNIFNEYFQEHETELRDQLENHPKLINELIKEHSQTKKAFENGMKVFAKNFFEIIEDNNISPYHFKGGGKNFGGIVNYYNRILNNQFSDDIFIKSIAKLLDPEESWTNTSKENYQKDEIDSLADTKLRALLQTTEAYRSKGLFDYNSANLLLKNIHQLGLLTDISKELEQENKENNRFMLSQTALFLNKIIKDSDASFVFEKIGAEIKHVMIDEFQDTSRLQWKNFKSLLSEVIANNNFSLLVGDVKQSIYRWRNGDWSILNNIENEFPVKLKSLNKNWRSEFRVVDFNNHFFIEAGKILDEKYIHELNGEENNPFAKAYNSEAVTQYPKDKEKGFVSVSQVKKDELEEYLLEQLVSFQKEGVKAKDICILTRTNKQIQKLAGFFSEQENSYPDLHKNGYLSIISNEAFQFSSSFAIKIIIEALRVVSDKDNPVPKSQLLLLWQEQIDSKESIAVHEILNKEKELDDIFPDGFKKKDMAQMELMPLYDLILYIHHIFIEKTAAGKSQSAFLFAFFDKVIQYLQNNPADIVEFVHYWEEELHRMTVPKTTEIMGVQAMTIHKSKGLEFHSVILPYCDWNMAKTSNYQQESIVWCDKKEAPFQLEILPINYTKTMHQSIFEEEFKKETMQLWMDSLNMLYVAFTRAEKNLCVYSQPPPSNGSTSLSISSLINEVLSKNLPLTAKENSYSYGIIVPSTEKIIEISEENILKDKQETNSINNSFHSNQHLLSKLEFRQSNKSKQFIETGEQPTENSYIQQGNLMHELFSKINTINDIEAAIDAMIFEGIIKQSEKPTYQKKIEVAIKKSNVTHWFDEKIKIFNECDILEKDNNGKLKQRRPDRVIMTDNEVIVIDYKFGEIRDSYNKQVQKYKQLLQAMGYQNIKGYIWYVEENKVVNV